jgi:hypothetical protein
MEGTPIWWSVSAIASPPMPPPAISTGLFVVRWTDLETPLRAMSYLTHYKIILDCYGVGR